jgi:tetratricopeptide (TPR) repeat protein
VLFRHWRNLPLDALYREGLDALDQGRYSRAISIAKEAHRRNNSMGFELEARALWGRGDWERALALARQGTVCFPTVATLWSYYGEFASELGRYDDATAAFMRSGEGVGASPPRLVEYNLGVIAHRRGRLTEAIHYYQSAIGAPGERPEAHVLWAEQAYAHALLREWEEAREAIAQFDSAPLDEMSESLAARLESARIACNSDEPVADLMALFKTCPHNVVPMIRSVEGRTSKFPQRFILYVQDGRSKRWALVAAENEGQAIEFYDRFWPRQRNRSIRVREDGPADGEFLGVVNSEDRAK